MNKLQNKWLLIDTNVIIESSLNNNLFKPFYDELKNLSIEPVLHPLVEFEFLRSSSKPLDHKTKLEFLTQIFGGGKERKAIPITDVMLEDSRKISMILRAFYRSKLQKNYTDVIVAAQMKNYANNLYLATLNHCDFPLILFDRIDKRTFDLKDGILCLGIYKFSTKKYDELIERWLKIP